MLTTWLTAQKQQLERAQLCPREMEYLSSTHLQEGFKSNPSQPQCFGDENNFFDLQTNVSSHLCYRALLATRNNSRGFIWPLRTNVSKPRGQNESPNIGNSFTGGEQTRMWWIWYLANENWTGTGLKRVNLLLWRFLWGRSDWRRLEQLEQCHILKLKTTTNHFIFRPVIYVLKWPDYQSTVPLNKETAVTCTGQ